MNNETLNLSEMRPLPEPPPTPLSPPPPPPPPQPPLSSQAVKKRRATVNEELAALVRSHLPHLSYQQVASPDFDLSSNNLEEAVRAKIEDKRRQVGKLKY